MFGSSKCLHLALSGIELFVISITGGAVGVSFVVGCVVC